MLLIGRLDRKEERSIARGEPRPTDAPFTPARVRGGRTIDEAAAVAH